jgi:tropomyosin 1
MEEELKDIGNNMKQLETIEVESIARQETLEATIKDLQQRLREAEVRADMGERSMGKLQMEVEKLEDELLAEQDKYRDISDELDQTLNDLNAY